MKIKMKLAALLLTLSMILSCTPTAMAQGTSPSETPSEEIVESTLNGSEQQETPSEETEAPKTVVAERSSTSTALMSDLIALAQEKGLSDLFAEEDPDEELTVLKALSGLMQIAGLKAEQLGNYPDDHLAMAQSMGLLSKNDDGSNPCTLKKLKKLAGRGEIAALEEAIENEHPLFLNGMAQPIFPYTSGKMDNKTYSNETSNITRFSVYVETDFDTDGDGKLDLVKALVQVPRAAVEGKYQAGVLMEARPYVAGTVANRVPMAKEGKELDLYQKAAPRVYTGKTSTLEHAKDADSQDWYYYNHLDKGATEFCYENLDTYDSYLVRGFAVVETGGLGTRGSEGFETCGSDLEIAAFKNVIEWLHGDRVAYTDKTSNVTIDADWCNGKVGMTGRSYAGTTQFGLASTGVEGLETIVPVAGIASWYEYTNSQGMFTRTSPAYTHDLARFCASRYLDSDDAAAPYKDSKNGPVIDPADHPLYKNDRDFETVRENYMAHLRNMYNEQYDLYGDYGDHTYIRDYTEKADHKAASFGNFKCSALIVHGLNDYNVRTKHFDMMWREFAESGCNVKLLLHQDAHLTPTLPGKGFAFDIGDETYDEILNRWFSHYLYGVENGAEDMAAVIAEDAHDADVWHTFRSWDEADKMLIKGTGSEAVTIGSGVQDKTGRWDTDRWAEVMVTDPDVKTYNDINGSTRFTMDVTKDTIIKGVSEVKFTASVNYLKEALANGELMDTDALMVGAMLVDIAPEGQTFPVFQPAGYKMANLYSSYLPHETVKEGGAWMGGGLKNLDLVKHTTTDASWQIVTRGWMDLCNPTAGYESITAAQTDRVNLQAGKTYDYTIYFQPTVYEVPAGHTLALILFADEAAMGRNYSYDNGQEYTITMDPTSIVATVPVEPRKGGTSSGGSHSGGSSSSGTVKEDVPATPTTPTVSFNDVPASAYYFDAVKWAQEKGITNGKANGLFGSNDPCTRGQIVTFLWRAAGSPAPKGTAKIPTDVLPGSYCYDAVAWAIENGITNGFADGTFGVNNTCTRGQSVTFLYRAMGSAPTTTNGFTDVAANTFCADAVAWAVENGVTNGTTASTFSPSNGCTRAQIVTFLFRAYQGK